LEQQLDDNLFKQKFKQLLEQLPVQMREVLALKYFEDFTFEQIAEYLDQPLNTVKSNFYRGKAKLYASIK
jgi:RNA polymerase sigma-70 factor (ECF subfamily)